MNILRRGVPETKEDGRKGAAETTVSRRIEVTAERETVTVLVRGQPAQSQEAPAFQRAAPESGRPALPPPAPAREDNEKNCP
jgi:hypothetical protein